MAYQPKCLGMPLLQHYLLYEKMKKLSTLLFAKNLQARKYCEIYTKLSKSWRFFYALLKNKI